MSFSHRLPCTFWASLVLYISRETLSWSQFEPAPHWIEIPHQLITVHTGICLCRRGESSICGGSVPFCSSPLHLLPHMGNSLSDLSSLAKISLWWERLDNFWNRLHCSIEGGSYLKLHAANLNSVKYFASRKDIIYINTYTRHTYFHTHTYIHTYIHVYVY